MQHSSPPPSPSPLSTHPNFSSRRPSVVSTLPPASILALSPRSQGSDEDDSLDIEIFQVDDILQSNNASGVLTTDESVDRSIDRSIDRTGAAKKISGNTETEIVQPHPEADSENIQRLGNTKMTTLEGEDYVVVEKVVTTATPECHPEEGLLIVGPGTASSGECPDFVLPKHHSRRSWTLQRSHRIRSSVGSTGEGGGEELGEGGSMLAEWFGRVMEKIAGGK
ncbi:hypothetical protein TrCOL_g2401 [Triparma columacea]|uniref:Uncharacterized protein n=1 Tax=Triparma columacea TaxID=722753 RepID=A0A9W7L197_9STRA|nr:hypothetical protein TrCOL_g2401 [Triparma columacea]